MGPVSSRIARRTSLALKGPCTHYFGAGGHPGRGIDGRSIVPLLVREEERVAAPASVRRHLDSLVAAGLKLLRAHHRSTRITTKALGSRQAPRTGRLVQHLHWRSFITVRIDTSMRNTTRMASRPTSARLTCTSSSTLLLISSCTTFTTPLHQSCAPCCMKRRAGGGSVRPKLHDVRIQVGESCTNCAGS